MKPSKSTQSLHTAPAFILREHSHNTLSLFRTLKPPPRSTLSSVYNARGRLSTLRDTLTILADQTHQAQITNKDLKLGIQFLREELLERSLPSLQAQLSSTVKQLRKRVVISRRSDLLKYESIQHILDSLGKSHKELSGKVAQVESRVEMLENIMGGGDALRTTLGR